MIVTSQNKESLIKDYNRRHSCIIAISKLESGKSIGLTNYNYNGLEQDQVQGNKTVKKKRHHKGSCDSSNLSNGSGKGGQISNKLLRLKAEAVMANKNSTVTGQLSMSNMNNSHNNVKANGSSQRNTIKSKYVASHKDSNLSSAMNYQQMDESVAPPMIIDNSAVLFSNTKKK